MFLNPKAYCPSQYAFVDSGQRSWNGSGLDVFSHDPADGGIGAALPVRSRKPNDPKMASLKKRKYKSSFKPLDFFQSTLSLPPQPTLARP